MVALQHESGARDRILNAARELFAAKGFHQSAVAELAAAAHVSIGQIYRLFKGKEDIIEAIVKGDAREREATILSLRKRLDAGEISIERTFELLLLDVMDNPHEALSFDIMAEGFRNARVADMITDMCQGFRDSLADFACAANPRLSGEALKSAEEMMLACLFGLGHRSLSGPVISAERTAKCTAVMIVAALRAMD
ncbi:TetR/AcrR family transcriptional regulator [Sphingobium indicum]|uniref:Transcriptional regulator n=3 Tax=Sphingobium indicum TaxID=332055 RepID=A0A8E1C3C8_9SPHN|nr:MULTISPECIES: TetR/AcrR family transcriptional regulator [Sphingobium]KEY97365.1 transcriptional regulator [Sphingomonas sp. BHC-A]APL93937.1 transcriptional regulator [Sphingobium indicum B90A]KER36169.1 transcriptional regulator [Sphingobium indicum F2]KER36818.1 transcriptional regulator [Sphingobium indicum F2]NYI21489.1 TetR/AcrR family transcriptional repressor of uid operon [Sphingobium indicum]